jgi:uncharacterized protein (DUF983 family)
MLDQLIDEINTIKKDKYFFQDKLKEVMSDPQKYYISSICPKCHPENGRLYVQAAETTCDYQCGLCHTEYDVYIVDKKTKEKYKK